MFRFAHHPQIAHTLDERTLRTDSGAAGLESVPEALLVFINDSSATLLGLRERLENNAKPSDYRVLVINRSGEEQQKGVSQFVDEVIGTHVERPEGNLSLDLVKAGNNAIKRVTLRCLVEGVKYKRDGESGQKRKTPEKRQPRKKQKQHHPQQAQQREQEHTQQQQQQQQEYAQQQQREHEQAQQHGQQQQQEYAQHQQQQQEHAQQHEQAQKHDQQQIMSEEYRDEMMRRHELESVVKSWDDAQGLSPAQESHLKHLFAVLEDRAEKSRQQDERKAQLLSSTRSQSEWHMHVVRNQLCNAYWEQRKQAEAREEADDIRAKDTLKTCLHNTRLLLRAHCQTDGILQGQEEHALRELGEMMDVDHEELRSRQEEHDKYANAIKEEQAARLEEAINGMVTKALESMGASHWAAYSPPDFVKCLEMCVSAKSYAEFKRASKKLQFVVHPDKMSETYKQAVAAGYIRDDITEFQKEAHSIPVCHRDYVDHVIRLLECDGAAV